MDYGHLRTLLANHHQSERKIFPKGQPVRVALSAFTPALFYARLGLLMQCGLLWKCRILCAMYFKSNYRADGAVNLVPYECVDGIIRMGKSCARTRGKQT